MRQSDHVSPETGQRLKETGLTREWQVGDWVQWDGRAYLIIHLGRGWNDVNVYLSPLNDWVHARDCTWLPSTGQLLQALSAAGVAPNLDYSDGRWYAGILIPGARDYGRAVRTEVEHEQSPAEALAEVWLRAHGQKGEA